MHAQLPLNYIRIPVGQTVTGELPTPLHHLMRAWN